MLLTIDKDKQAADNEEDANHYVVRAQPFNDDLFARSFQGEDVLITDDMGDTLMESYFGNVSKFVPSLPSSYTKKTPSNFGGGGNEGNKNPDIAYMLQIGCMFSAR